MAQELGEKMRDAVTKDNENNKNGIPALNKLMLLDEVTRELKRSSLQQ